MAIPRGRIPLLAGGAALTLAAAILVIRQAAPPEKVDSATEPPSLGKASASVGNRPSKPVRQPPSSALRHLPDLPDLVEPPHPAGSPENQDWIDKRTEELDALSWHDDHESLAKILTELRNPLPEIRTAALEAVKSFGSRDAIPYLEAISRDLKEPSEQKAIAGVIEHLNLPTVLEKSDWDEADGGVPR